jgi:hypothetical protein
VTIWPIVVDVAHQKNTLVVIASFVVGLVAKEMGQMVLAWVVKNVVFVRLDAYVSLLAL